MSTQLDLLLSLSSFFIHLMGNAICQRASLSSSRLTEEKLTTGFSQKPLNMHSYCSRTIRPW